MNEGIDVRQERQRLLARKAALLERTLLTEDPPDDEVVRELRDVALALDRLRRGEMKN